MSGEVGRCGAEAPTVVAPSGLDVCALPSGHVGWHRSDNGTEWTERGSHDHRPAPSPAADVCACGCDIADHGLSFGCIRCRNCTEFAERSTYVPLAERPSPSPAADDEFPCGWCNADGSEGHRTDCPSWADAPSPAAEPPQGLRERWLASDMEQPWFRNLIAEITAEHRGDLAEWAERIARTYSRSGTLEITAVVWMLLDRIDVLLAQAATDRAAVERVDHVIALYRGHSGAYVDVAQIRRALSGDAR